MRYDADVAATRRVRRGLDGAPALRGRVLGRGLEERVGRARRVAAFVADSSELGPSRGAVAWRQILGGDLAQDHLLAAPRLHNGTARRN